MEQLQNAIILIQRLFGWNDVGGIVGLGMYNVQINNCYNSGILEGKICVGGIVGYGAAVDIRYCYNNKQITGASYIGGIAGYLTSFYEASYTNNYLYYCYNVGKVTGTNDLAGMAGVIKYYNINYVYSLTNTATSNFAQTSGNNAGTYKGMLDKSDLISIVLSNFGDSFIEDYSGEESINDGYPILNWQ